MFTKDEKMRPKEVETIIGPSVKVKGEFNGQGDIVVEGIFEGTLKTTSGIFIGDNAKIIADIEAKDCTIGGEVVGNIKLRGFLDLGPGAKIMGDIEALSLSVSKGAVINGKITMMKNHQGEIKETK